MAEYTDPDLFVFLDESAVDQSTAERLFGRSTIGTRCVRRASFVRGIRHSIIPALSCNGIIARRRSKLALGSQDKIRA